jgi:imidazolonepropionase-like amidohydrolase
VRCIEHGQLVDEATVALMAEYGTWWCLQPFLDDEDANPHPEPAKRAKQVQVAAGTDLAYELARKHGVKVAWAATSCTTRSSRRVRALGSRS